MKLELKKTPQSRIHFFQQFVDKDRVNTQCLTYKMRDKLIRALPHWLLKENIEEIPPRIWFCTLEVAYDSLFRTKNLEWKKKNIFFTVAEVWPGDPKPIGTTASSAWSSTLMKKNQLTRTSKTPKATQVKVPLEPTITVQMTDDDDESVETSTFVPIEQTNVQNPWPSKRNMAKVAKSTTTDNLKLRAQI